MREKALCIFGVVLYFPSRNAFAIAMDFDIIAIAIPTDGGFMVVRDFACGGVKVKLTHIHSDTISIKLSCLLTRASRQTFEKGIFLWYLRHTLQRERWRFLPRLLWS